MRRAALLMFVVAAAACNTAELATPAEGSAESAGATELAAGQVVAPVPKELPDVLAEVNGESVERWELEMAIREIEGLSMHPIPASQRDKVYRTVLDRLIGHHLVAQEARANNLRVSAADVEEAIALERKDFPNAAAFEKSLAELGTPIDLFRRQRRLSLEVERFVRANIMPSINVPTEDVESYYRENLPEYQRPETVTASHILIRIYPDSTEQQKNEARARATGILTRLRGGADFARTAQQESQDSATAASGGSLGTISRGSADPAFDTVAFNLKPGELSGVVETPFGFHIIRTGQHQPARTVPLAEVRVEIEDELSQDVQQAKLAEWLQQARAKAKIEIFI